MAGPALRRRGPGRRSFTLSCLGWAVKRSGVIRLTVAAMPGLVPYTPIAKSPANSLVEFLVHTVVRLLSLLPAAVLMAPSLSGQSAAPLAPPRSVAVFDVALYTAGANKQEVSDTSRAALATQVLRAKLQELLGSAIIEAGVVESLAVSPKYHGFAGDRPCNVIVACTKAVGTDLGATWIVMAKVSKTSNLIWLLTSQLIHLPTGEIVLDDSTELKGDPEPMVRAGTRIFAERVARTIRARGREQAAGS